MKVPIPEDPKRRTKELMETRRIIQNQFHQARNILESLKLSIENLEFTEDMDGDQVIARRVTITIGDVDGRKHDFTLEVNSTKQEG